MVTILMGLIFSVVNIYISFILNQVIDVVIEKDIENFTNVTLKAVLYFSCISICYYLYIISVRYTINVIIRDLRNDIFKGILNLDYNSYKLKNIGDYISDISNDINIIEESYLVPLIYGIQQMFLFFGALFSLIKISLTITLCLIFCIVLTIIFPCLYSKILQKNQKKYSEKMSEFINQTNDFFSGYSIIKSYNILNVILERFEKINIELYKTKLKKEKVFSINESVSFFFSFFSQILILLVGAYLILIDDITMGMLVAIIQLSGNFVNPISNIIQSFSKVNSTNIICKKISKYSEYKNDKNDKKNIKFNEKIILKNLEFHYNNDFQIKLVDFIFEKGKKYVILGKSGSGKTTFVNLLTGREKNYQGNIYVDDVSIRNISQYEINQLISYNQQDIFLFNASVKENISLFQEFPEKVFNDILVKAGVNKFLDQLSNGINTVVGEKGCKLSGGQKQCISLARALLQEKPILVVDEGMSALDMNTAFEIENKLLEDDQLTLITITHQISPKLLSKYDLIILMEDGSIKGTGNYKDMINKMELKDFFLNEK